MNILLDSIALFSAIGLICYFGYPVAKINLKKRRDDLENREQNLVIELKNAQKKYEEAHELHLQAISRKNLWMEESHGEFLLKKKVFDEECEKKIESFKREALKNFELFQKKEEKEFLGNMIDMLEQELKNEKQPRSPISIIKKIDESLNIR